MSIDDDAERFEQLDRDLCLKMRRPSLPITGFCHWCNESAKGVFCGTECRDDWNKQQRFNR